MVVAPVFVAAATKETHCPVVYAEGKIVDVEPLTAFAVPASVRKVAFLMVLSSTEAAPTVCQLHLPPPVEVRTYPVVAVPVSVQGPDLPLALDPICAYIDPQPKTASSNILVLIG
jgi:hypothetical protein